VKKISETKITHGVSIEADWRDVTALEWRAVVGYEDSYEVSNTGLVRSIDREVECSDGKVRFVAGILLHPIHKNHKLTRVVHLCCADGHPKKIPIARLVWEAFIGIEAIKICHIGDSGNNNVNNLKAKLPDGSWL